MNTLIKYRNASLFTGILFSNVYAGCLTAITFPFLAVSGFSNLTMFNGLYKTRLELNVKRLAIITYGFWLIGGIRKNKAQFKDAWKYHKEYKRIYK